MPKEGKQFHDRARAKLGLSPQQKLSDEDKRFLDAFHANLGHLDDEYPLTYPSHTSEVRKQGEALDERFDRPGFAQSLQFDHAEMALHKRGRRGALKGQDLRILN